MKMRRTIVSKIAMEYNTLAEYVNKREVVIYIKGKLYDEMKDKAFESKITKNNKKLGGLLVIGGLLTGGAISLLLGASSLVYSKISKDDFKDYKVKINKNEKRIELYLNKGENKYDPKYDTII